MWIPHPDAIFGMIWADLNSSHRRSTRRSIELAMIDPGVWVDGKETKDKLPFCGIVCGREFIGDLISEIRPTRQFFRR
jgi:hypothetical protein